MSEVKSKEKVKFKVPHVFAILFALIVVSSVLTYIIPAGSYERILMNGRAIIDPETFRYIEKTPVSLMDTLNAITIGIQEVADIIAFLLIMGGAFEVIQATGALEIGVGKIAIASAKTGKDKLIIPILMTVFGIGGLVIGAFEEVLPFLAMLVMLSMSMGFDSITGYAMGTVGAMVGTSVSIMSPFTTGVAQTIAELPYMSGWQFRAVAFVFMQAIAMTYIWRYASKVRENPQSSIMYELDKKRGKSFDLDNLPPLTKRHKLILLAFLGMIVALVVGVVKFGWGITEMSSLFIIISIIIAIIYGMKVNEYAETFATGLTALAVGAAVVGLSRAILVVLTQGNIIDTILHSAANALSFIPSTISALGIYVFQVLLNVIIPSGSGQAAVTMPIIAPLSDLIGVTRQTSVIAFGIGDSLTNLFSPTVGAFMAGLSIAKIPWDKWARWFLPLLGLLFLGGGILVTIAHLIQLGPF